MTLDSEPLDLLLDADHDLVIGPGGFVIATGIQGAAQLCKVALLLLLGEWFLDQKRGLPWFPSGEDDTQALLGGKFNPLLTRQLVISTLLKVSDVVEVIAATVTLAENRRARIVARVRTSFGDTTIDTSVGGSGD